MFQKILHPIAISDFLKNYWEKRPLHIPGTPDKFKDYFSRAALEKALKQPSIDELILRASFIDPKGEYVDVFVSSDQILPLFDAGLTVSVASIQKADQRLEALRREIAQQFVTGRRFVFNCFFSPPDKGLGMHLDDHSVLLLQIEGEKRWTFSSRPVLSATPHNIILPPKGQKHPSFSGKGIARPRPADLTQVLLRSGDALYLPSGSWHQGRAGKNGSLGLSIAFTPLTARDIFTDLLSAYFKDSPAWQKILPAFQIQTLQTGSMPKDLKAILSKRLAEMKSMVQKLTIDELYSVWHRSATIADFEASNIPKKKTIGPKDKLGVVRTDPTTLLLGSGTNGRRTVSLFFRGSEIQYLESAYPFLSALLKQNQFTAISAQHWAGGQYTWESIKKTLQDLYEIGLLVRI